jgi:hypothetical protein
MKEERRRGTRIRRGTREIRRRILALCFGMMGFNPRISSRILLLYLDIRVQPILGIGKRFFFEIFQYEDYVANDIFNLYVLYL